MPGRGIIGSSLWLTILFAITLAPHPVNADSPRHSFDTSGAARSAPATADQGNSMHAAPAAKSSSNGGHSSGTDQTVKSTKPSSSHSSKGKSGDKKGSGGSTKKDTTKKAPATGKDVHKSGSGSKQTRGQPSKKPSSNDDKGHGATKPDNTKATNSKGTKTKETDSKGTKTKVTDDKGTGTKATGSKGTKTKATDEKGSQMIKGPVQQLPQPQQQQPYPPRKQLPPGSPHGLIDKDHVKTILPLPNAANQTSDTVADFLKASQHKAGQGIPAIGGGVGGVKTGQGIPAIGGGVGGVKMPVKVKMADSNQGGKNYYQNSDDTENGSGSIANPDSPFPAYMNFPMCTDRKGEERGNGRGEREGKAASFLVRQNPTLTRGTR